MMMTDPIADMLTRIRNGQQAEKRSVRMPLSRVKSAIAKVLKDEGYIEDYAERRDGTKGVLEVVLKYFEGKPVIERLERVSAPGYRRYTGKTRLPRVSGGLGVAVISTSRGIMSDRAARSAGLGGEIICIVS
ncbi:MAG: 30S ribosomal protein S8 [Acidithiobacillales bacterium SM23_46]|nr:MAG: 30S ribosomal protein S8 [Acidithiobacillales bacterium SM23_46]KPL27779.1 MAG: 30S ribosomal protein S8 [Acidithiobacillales bacterium SM1_46]